MKQSEPFCWRSCFCARYSLFCDFLGETWTWQASQIQGASSPARHDFLPFVSRLDGEKKSEPEGISASGGRINPSAYWRISALLQTHSFPQTSPGSASSRHFWQKPEKGISTSTVSYIWKWSSESFECICCSRKLCPLKWLRPETGLVRFEGGAAAHRELTGLHAALWSDRHIQLCCETNAGHQTCVLEALPGGHFEVMQLVCMTTKQKRSVNRRGGRGREMKRRDGVKERTKQRR